MHFTSLELSQQIYELNGWEGSSFKHRKKDNKWRLWTTTSDGWFTDWITADEMKQYLAALAKCEYQVKVIELYMTFPFDQIDSGSILEQSCLDAFYGWQRQAHKGNYFAEVDKKFKELTGEN